MICAVFEASAEGWVNRPILGALAPKSEPDAHARLAACTTRTRSDALMPLPLDGGELYTRMVDEFRREPSCVRARTSQHLLTGWPLDPDPAVKAQVVRNSAWDSFTCVVRTRR